MPYTNFTDAWTTMQNVFPIVEMGMVNFYNAKGSINPGITLANLITYTRRSFDYLYNALVEHMGINWLSPQTESWHDMAIYFAWAEGGDMQAIIDAMYKATFEQVREFIGLNWAFQQILWDQPFFPDQYAEIVQRLRT